MSVDPGAGAQRDGMACRGQEASWPRAGHTRFVRHARSCVHPARPSPLPSPIPAAADAADDAQELARRPPLSFLASKTGPLQDAPSAPAHAPTDLHERDAHHRPLNAAAHGMPSAGPSFLPTTSPTTSLPPPPRPPRRALGPPPPPPRRPPAGSPTSSPRRTAPQRGRARRARRPRRRGRRGRCTQTCCTCVRRRAARWCSVRFKGPMRVCVYCVGWCGQCHRGGGGAGGAVWRACGHAGRARPGAGGGASHREGVVRQGLGPGPTPTRGGGSKRPSRWGGNPRLAWLARFGACAAVALVFLLAEQPEPDWQAACDTRLASQPRTTNCAGHLCSASGWQAMNGSRTRTKGSERAPGHGRRLARLREPPQPPHGFCSQRQVVRPRVAAQLQQAVVGAGRRRLALVPAARGASKVWTTSTRSSASQLSCIVTRVMQLPVLH